MPIYIIRQKDVSWIPSTQNLTSHMKKIINDKIKNHIGVSPYKEECLHYELEGLWSYNKLETDSRIIYAICEDCRKRELTIMNTCQDCEEMTDNTIILWVFAGHEVYKNLKRTRKKAWKKLVKQRRRKRRN
ncbi:hypothetical protein ES702_04160 [subsurface metagenome]